MGKNTNPYYIDFPSLVRESRFQFKSPINAEVFDKNVLEALNIPGIVGGRDFETIEQLLPHISACKLDSKLMRGSTTNFIKLFKLSQLSLEYLLFCQEYLKESVKSLKLDIETLKNNQKNLKGKYNVAKQQSQHFKTALQMELNARPMDGKEWMVEGEQCAVCGRIFCDENYLMKHIIRRHVTMAAKSDTTYDTDYDVDDIPADEHHSHWKQIKNEIHIIEETLPDLFSVSTAGERNSYSDRVKANIREYINQMKRMREQFYDLRKKIEDGFKNVRDHTVGHDQFEMFLRALLDGINARNSNENSSIKNESSKISPEPERRHWQTQTDQEIEHSRSVFKKKSKRNLRFEHFTESTNYYEIIPSISTQTTTSKLDDIIDEHLNKNPISVIDIKPSRRFKNSNYKLDNQTIAASRKDSTTQTRIEDVEKHDKLKTIDEVYITKNDKSRKDKTASNDESLETKLPVKEIKDQKMLKGKQINITDIPKRSKMKEKLLLTATDTKEVLISDVPTDDKIDKPGAKANMMRSLQIDSHIENKEIGETELHKKEIDKKAEMEKDVTSIDESDKQLKPKLKRRKIREQAFVQETDTDDYSAQAEKILQKKKFNLQTAPSSKKESRQLKYKQLKPDESVYSETLSSSLASVKIDKTERKSETETTKSKDMMTQKKLATAKLIEDENDGGQEIIKMYQKERERLKMEMLKLKKNILPREDNEYKIKEKRNDQENVEKVKQTTPRNVTDIDTNVSEQNKPTNKVVTRKTKVKEQSSSADSESSEQKMVKKLKSEITSAKSQDVVETKLLDTNLKVTERLITTDESEQVPNEKQKVVRKKGLLRYEIERETKRHRQNQQKIEQSTSATETDVPEKNIDEIQKGTKEVALRKDIKNQNITFEKTKSLEREKEIDLSKQRSENDSLKKKIGKDKSNTEDNEPTPVNKDKSHLIMKDLISDAELDNSKAVIDKNKEKPKTKKYIVEVNRFGNIQTIEPIVHQSTKFFMNGDNSQNFGLYKHISFNTKSDLMRKAEDIDEVNAYEYDVDEILTAKSEPKPTLQYSKNEITFAPTLKKSASIPFRYKSEVDLTKGRDFSKPKDVQLESMEILIYQDDYFYDSSPRDESHDSAAFTYRLKKELRQKLHLDINAGISDESNSELLPKRYRNNPSAYSTQEPANSKKVQENTDEWDTSRGSFIEDLPLDEPSEPMIPPAPVISESQQCTHSDETPSVSEESSIEEMDERIKNEKEDNNEAITLKRSEKISPSKKSPVLSKKIRTKFKHFTSFYKRLWRPKKRTPIKLKGQKLGKPTKNVRGVVKQIKEKLSEDSTSYTRTTSDENINSSGNDEESDMSKVDSQTANQKKEIISIPIENFPKSRTSDLSRSLSDRTTDSDEKHAAPLKSKRSGNSKSSQSQEMISIPIENIRKSHRTDSSRSISNKCTDSDENNGEQLKSNRSTKSQSTKTEEIISIPVGIIPKSHRSDSSRSISDRSTDTDEKNAVLLKSDRSTISQSSKSGEKSHRSNSSRSFSDQSTDSSEKNVEPLKSNRSTNSQSSKPGESISIPMEIIPKSHRSDSSRSILDPSTDSDGKNKEPMKSNRSMYSQPSHTAEIISPKSQRSVSSKSFSERSIDSDEKNIKPLKSNRSVKARSSHMELNIEHLDEELITTHRSEKSNSSGRRSTKSDSSKMGENTELLHEEIIKSHRSEKSNSSRHRSAKPDTSKMLEIMDISEKENTSTESSAISKSSRNKSLKKEKVQNFVEVHVGTSLSNSSRNSTHQLERGPDSGQSSVDEVLKSSDNQQSTSESSKRDGKVDIPAKIIKLHRSGTAKSLPLKFNKREANTQTIDDTVIQSHRSDLHKIMLHKPSTSEENNDKPEGTSAGRIESRRHKILLGEDEIEISNYSVESLPKEPNLVEQQHVTHFSESNSPASVDNEATAINRDLMSTIMNEREVKSRSPQIQIGVEKSPPYAPKPKRKNLKSTKTKVKKEQRRKSSTDKYVLKPILKKRIQLAPADMYRISSKHITTEFQQAMKGIGVDPRKTGISIESYNRKKYLLENKMKGTPKTIVEQLGTNFKTDYNKWYKPPKQSKLQFFPIPTSPSTVKKSKFGFTDSYNIKKIFRASTKFLNPKRLLDNEGHSEMRDIRRFGIPTESSPRLFKRKHIEKEPRTIVRDVKQSPSPFKKKVHFL